MSNPSESMIEYQLAINTKRYDYAQDFQIGKRLLGAFRKHQSIGPYRPHSGRWKYSRDYRPERERKIDASPHNPWGRTFSGRDCGNRRGNYNPKFRDRRGIIPEKRNCDTPPCLLYTS